MRDTTKYVATVKHPTVIGYWDDLGSGNLKEAKAEAAKRFGLCRHDHVIALAIKHADGDLQEIAHRKISEKIWINVY